MHEASLSRSGRGHDGGAPPAAAAAAPSDRQNAGRGAPAPSGECRGGASAAIEWQSTHRRRRGFDRAARRAAWYPAWYLSISLPLRAAPGSAPRLYSASPKHVSDFVAPSGASGGDSAGGRFGSTNARAMPAETTSSASAPRRRPYISAVNASESSSTPAREAATRPASSGGSREPPCGMDTRTGRGCARQPPPGPPRAAGARPSRSPLRCRRGAPRRPPGTRRRSACA